MNRTTTLLAAAVLALGACKGSTGSPDPKGGEDAFDSGSLGRYSSYTEGGYDWKIVSSALIGTGPANQSVLLRTGVTMADGWVEADSRRADDGGLVLRFQDGAHYYLLAFRDDDAPSPRGTENLAVYHHVGSEYDQMWVKNVDWPRGTRHTIHFEAAGNLLRVYFDGVQQVELTPSPAINDPAPYTGTGALGVRHYGADNTWISTFDSFRWRIVN